MKKTKNDEVERAMLASEIDILLCNVEDTTALKDIYRYVYHKLLDKYRYIVSCPVCDHRILDNVDAIGRIRIKCPHCKKEVIVVIRESAGIGEKRRFQTEG